MPGGKAPATTLPDGMERTESLERDGEVSGVDEASRLKEQSRQV